jgi:hypothetical protein
VRFRPYLDKSIVYRQVFPLVIAEIQPEDIVDRVSLERPDVPGRRRIPTEFGEVMKVQDRGRYWLIHRNRGYGAAMVYRICELDADTRLAATLESDASRENVQPQIGVVYNRQGTQYRLRMSPFGSVLEDAKLGTANLHERYIEERYHRYPL